MQFGVSISLSPFPCIFSHPNMLYLSHLWASCGPPARQLHPRHPSADIFNPPSYPNHLNPASLTLSPNYLTCSVLWCSSFLLPKRSSTSSSLWPPALPLIFFLSPAISKALMLLSHTAPDTFLPPFQPAAIWKWRHRSPKVPDCAYFSMSTRVSIKSAVRFKIKKKERVAEHTVMFRALLFICDYRNGTWFVFPSVGDHLWSLNQYPLIASSQAAASAAQLGRGGGGGLTFL